MTEGAEIGLAEVAAAMSLASDLASGATLEHGLRTTLLTLRLAERAGLADDVRRDAFYTSLFRAVGCTSDAHEQAVLFGDELVARTELNLAPHLSPTELTRALARHVGAGRTPLRRAALLARTMAAGGVLPRAVAAAHCEAAERLAARFGAGRGVATAVRCQFERWDGKGYPGTARGDAIPLATRIVQVASSALLLHEQLGDPERVFAAGGSLYDPAVLALLTREDTGSVLETVSAWDEVLAREPGGARPLADEELDAACRAAADFTDLKSPWLLGHSPAVAELAEAAAWRLGLETREVATVRRSALLHDLGRVAVPSGVWDRSGPLSGGEWELVRLHAYQSERLLARSPGLARLGAVAGAHHERLDGSGYHRGSRAAQLGTAARLLAAADVFQALTEARPHRPALEPAVAAEGLESEVRAGRIDGPAAAAVLAAAGQRTARRPRVLPAGLTEREAHVLALLARGRRNREIAERLGISAKTVGHHVQHVYAKIGVSSRASAALYALEHDLLDA